jgi:hypothetical protein
MEIISLDRVLGTGDNPPYPTHFKQSPSLTYGKDKVFVESMLEGDLNAIIVRAGALWGNHPQIQSQFFISTLSSLLQRTSVIVDQCKKYTPLQQRKWLTLYISFGCMKLMGCIKLLVKRQHILTGLSCYVRKEIKEKVVLGLAKRRIKKGEKK